MGSAAFIPCTSDTTEGKLGDNSSFIASPLLHHLLPFSSFQVFNVHECGRGGGESKRWRLRVIRRPKNGSYEGEQDQSQIQNTGHRLNGVLGLSSNDRNIVS